MHATTETDRVVASRTGQTFYTLDLLRGFSAIIVMLGHVTALPVAA